MKNIRKSNSIFIFSMFVFIGCNQFSQTCNHFVTTDKDYSFVITCSNEVYIIENRDGEIVKDGEHYQNLLELIQKNKGYFSNDRIVYISVNNITHRSICPGSSDGHHDMDATTVSDSVYCGTYLLESSDGLLHRYSCYKRTWYYECTNSGCNETGGSYTSHSVPH